MLLCLQLLTDEAISSRWPPITYDGEQVLRKGPGERLFDETET